MKAWQVSQWCKPEDMEFVDLPVPEPGPKEVLVEVTACGVNFMDSLMVQGLYQVKPTLPFTPGCEISGVIAKVGPGSVHKVGDRVCGILDWGGFAEYGVVKDDSVINVPDGVDLIPATAIPAVYPTSYSGLKMTAHLQPGETVLVHAGAGGVGVAAIQFAKAWGAKVIATAGSDEKVKICLEQGADIAINYSTEDWLTLVKEHTSGKGVDIIYDPVGGDITDQSVRALAWRGRLLIVGFAGGRIAEIPANRLLLKNAAVMGVVWGGHLYNQPEAVQPVYEEIFAMLQRGEINPLISKKYPLSEATQAVIDLASRKTHGKVLLIP